MVWYVMLCVCFVSERVLLPRRACIGVKTRSRCAECTSFLQYEAPSCLLSPISSPLYEGATNVAHISSGARCACHYTMDLYLSGRLDVELRADTECTELHESEVSSAKKPAIPFSCYCGLYSCDMLHRIDEDITMRYYCRSALCSYFLDSPPVPENILYTVQLRLPKATFTLGI